MSNVKFYPNDGRQGVLVSSKQDIIDYMGEIGDSLNSIDILESGAVIGYIAEQGVQLVRIERNNQ